MVAMKDDQDVVIVNEDDLTFLKITNDMPYLKHIELVNLTPQQFNLTKWEPHFIIPDSWMQKLYKEDMYIDTEVEKPVKEAEQITKEQQDILGDYLRKNRRFEDAAISKTRNSSEKRIPIDNLFEELQAFDKEHDIDDAADNSMGTVELRGTKSESNKRNINIEVCRMHRVQSEGDIVLKAIDKMKQLDVEEEAKFQRLIRDKEFMEFLDDQIGKYVKKNQL